jgi:hypothetical protein
MLWTVSIWITLAASLGGIALGAGKETAANVEVFVSSVWETVQAPIRTLIPSGGEPLRASHSKQTAQAVPPGASRQVEFVELGVPDRMVFGPSTQEATLLLAGTPFKLTKGRPCRVQLEVAGANVDAKTFTCDVEWKGELEQDGFPQEALEIRGLAEQRPAR